MFGERFRAYSFVRFVVEPEIFAAFPGIRIVVAVARGVNNASTYPQIATRWIQTWAAAQEAEQYGNSQSHPRVRPWREAWVRIGVSGKKFPSSIEALLRRALKAGDPVVVNPLVDFYNTVSLEHVVPAGGFDLGDLDDDLMLRLTRDGDSFEALDQDQATTLPTGEVAYATGANVLTRHFVWRQSRRGLIRPESRDVALVSEILPQLPREVVGKVEADLVGGLRSIFGVDGQSFVVDSTQPGATW